MRRLILSTALATALVGAVAPPAGAQPAKGAPAALERARETMATRFRDTKLTGDPDRDFAALLIASFEETLFLAQTELDYGGDPELRAVARKIQDEQQARIDALKQWQLHRREAGERAQPDLMPSGEGPPDRPAEAAATKTQPASPPAPAASANAPLVAATVKKVDAAAIPNLGMDAMTMAYRVQDPALLKGLTPGEAVRFSAERLNGSLAVTRIQKAR
jgi:Cu/Ag efflux protein CusF